MYTLYQDNKPLLVTEKEIEIWDFMHRRCGYSMSHAFEYEGYTITKDGVDITKEYILKDIKK